jgi:hypothetical protein
LWPIAEPAQADYEQLRELALTGGELGGLFAARRFERRGLARWCGAEDPREAWLCDTYAFLLGRDTDSQRLEVVGR